MDTGGHFVFVFAVSKQGALGVQCASVHNASSQQGSRLKNRGGLRSVSVMNTDALTQLRVWRVPF